MFLRHVCWHVTIHGRLQGFQKMGSFFFFSLPSSFIVQSQMIVLCLRVRYHRDRADSSPPAGAHIPIVFLQPALLPDPAAQPCQNEMLKTSHSAVRKEIKTQL